MIIPVTILTDVILLDYSRFVFSDETHVLCGSVPLRCFKDDVIRLFERESELEAVHDFVFLRHEEDGRLTCGGPLRLNLGHYSNSKLVSY